MIGYVYLMTNGKEYKIGLTGSEPEKRMKQLQTGNSSKIELVGCVICKDMESLESSLHREYSLKRQTGEWFALNDNDLHAIFERFKIESINDDMSLIPKIVTDVEKLMQIDGERLANGKNLLNRDKYLHIENHKDVVIKYMQEKKVLIDNIKLKKKKRKETELEKYEKQEKLIQKDARRIIKGEKPLYTFDYADFNDWKSYLESEINEIKYELEDLMGRDVENIARGRKTKYVKYKQMVGWEKIMEPMIKREKEIFKVEKKAYQKAKKRQEEAKKIQKKEAHKKQKDIKKKKDLEKEIRKKELRLSADEYRKKDDKRVKIGLNKIYREYYREEKTERKNVDSIKGLFKSLFMS